MSNPESRLTTQSIRSFVLRQGRMSPAQHHAYDTLMPRYGVAFAQTRLDFATAFGRTAPTILEIGCGMGETTARIAAAMPDHNFLGVEVHTPGVGALLKLIDADGLDNVRVLQHDAVEVVQHMIGERSLAGVHLFFPDPWPKARHHKRRIVQAPFIHMLASRLGAGGYLHCATDWEPYAQWMLEVLSSEPALQNTSIDFAQRPAYRPVTKFETRGVKLGHGVWDLLFRTLP